MDNFYTILPSNSCPLTQPMNNASNFIIDWENSMQLKGNWEAALTEFSFNYSPLTIKSGAIIECGFIPSYNEVAFTFDLVQYTYKDISTELKIFSGTHIGFYYKGLPFKIIFSNIEEAKMLGFEKKSYTSFGLPIKANNAYDVTLKNKEIKLTYSVMYTDTKIIDKDLLFRDSKHLIAYFNSNFLEVFSTFTINKSGIINFELHKDVGFVKLDENLCNILGLPQTIYINEIGDSFEGINTPKLESAFQQMYLYTSLTEPILVGSTRVPLLRSIWIENNKYKYGDVVCIKIDNPMYLPVSSSSINNIEVNIRDDFGKPISFTYGAKTSLTVHFRKNGKS